MTSRGFAGAKAAKGWENHADIKNLEKQNQIWKKTTLDSLDGWTQTWRLRWSRSFVAKAPFYFSSHGRDIPWSEPLMWKQSQIFITKCQRTWRFSKTERFIACFVGWRTQELSLVEIELRLKSCGKCRKIQDIRSLIKPVACEFSLTSSFFRCGNLDLLNLRPNLQLDSCFSAWQDRMRSSTWSTNVRSTCRPVCVCVAVTRLQMLYLSVSKGW